MTIKILFTLCGLAVGVVQYFLTMRTAMSFISKRTLRGIACLCAKTVIYVAFFGTVVWFLENGSLFLALSYGVGIVFSAVLSVLLSMKRNGGK